MSIQGIHGLASQIKGPQERRQFTAVISTHMPHQTELIYVKERGSMRFFLGVFMQQ